MAPDAAGGVGRNEEEAERMIFAGRLVLILAVYVVVVWYLWQETPLG